MFMKCSMLVLVVVFLVGCATSSGVYLTPYGEKTMAERREAQKCYGHDIRFRESVVGSRIKRRIPGSVRCTAYTSPEAVRQIMRDISPPRVFKGMN